MIPSKQKLRRKSAFTLIEIMVATVIMVILVGLVIQITSEVLKVWNRSSGKLSANAEARIAMDLLTQDLEAAVFRNNGMRWLEARQENLGDPFGGNVSFKTTELKLFAPALDRPEGPGDISGISYLLRYSDPVFGRLNNTSSDSTDNRTFILYRNVIDPKTTFEQLMGKDNQERFDQAGWSEVETIDQGRNYLAANIIDFRVEFYLADEDGSQITESVLLGGAGATAGIDASDENRRYPLLYAEITLKIISDEALKVIQNDAISQFGYDRDLDYVNANAEVYTRRVNFMARPF